ncbi:hypothetical protein Tco_0231746 [Tanacetum coccineum]
MVGEEKETISKKTHLKETNKGRRRAERSSKKKRSYCTLLIGFLDVLSLSLSLLPVQLILKLLGKRHGKCTDFVRAVRKIIDSFEELRQHKQVDGVIALRQTGFRTNGGNPSYWLAHPKNCLFPQVLMMLWRHKNFGCIADGEAALPPSKQLHRLWEDNSA